MKKLFLLVFIILLGLPSVMAHCPLCTGATIVGVGFTRGLGLDDSLVGVFAGGMVLSSALWINNILKKKNVGGNELLRSTALVILTLALTLITFYSAGLVGPANDLRIFGVERLVFGTASGMLVSVLALVWSNNLKKNNGGKARFAYQTMTLSLLALVLNAAVFLIIF